MAREPLTTKTWSSYDRSSWQSEPSKESRWRDQRRTSLGKFIKGTREVTRKSQWQKQQENSGKQRVKQSTPQNGRRKKDYSGSEARSMFPRTRTCEGEWSCCAMIQRLPDILDAGKHWS